MKHLLPMVCMVLALLLLTACGKTTPAPPQMPDTPPAAEETVQEVSDDRPDLTVFAGTYRANVPPEGDEGYVQITARGDFLMLEHFLCMEGSVYSFWAEEFWPGEDGIAETPFLSVSGMSQTFSAMTASDLYDTMPQNRVISLTDEGVVLQYDDSDAEYYVRDETYTCHTTREALRLRLGEDIARQDPELFGTWSVRSSREAVSVTFEEGGTVTLVRKKIGEPAQIYDGGYIFSEDGVQVMAEKAGDGLYPHVMSWPCRVDADGMLWLTLDEEKFVLLPTQEIPRSVGRQEALSCIGALYDLSGSYTDQYETDYDYRYRLPMFYGDDAAAMAVNRQISEKFAPIIEEEQKAIAEGEFLSYTEVDFEQNVYEDVLYLHVYAKTWDWEEHAAYYYDTKTAAFLSPEEVLDRLLIDHSYFLEAVREHAAAVFEETFGDLSEEFRQESGYYEMQEWTVSDEAVNLQLPIFVDRFGGISVYAKIGSMAGSGIIWNVLRPFDGAVG